ncbi:MAG: LacI family DNA-binding transcriptional regulator [Lachnospiraceae bacterium]|nr:LacI family DNA-binding transcriptional regulator [Lachnospiraceae bacterium]
MTLKDIAAEAHVSVMTVSNVVNGKHDKVSSATIEKVMAIVNKYHYVPNLTAKSLTAKSSNLVAVIVPFGETENDINFFENPYISTMIGVMEKKLREYGYYVIIRSVGTKGDITRLLKNWNVAGALFLIPSFETMIDSLLSENDFPLVFFDSRSDNRSIMNVKTDDYKGGYIAAKYLINHGHKKIAFVADYRDSVILLERYRGYRDALTESRIRFQEDWVYFNAPTYEDGIQTGKQLAERTDPVTAAMSTADICSIGIMEGARLGGLRIPSDLSVIGFDNLDLCRYTTPKLTTVSQHITAKAERAVALLLEKLEKGTVEKTTVMLDVEIIERQSVAFLD